MKNPFKENDTVYLLEDNECIEGKIIIINNDMVVAVNDRIKLSRHYKEVSFDPIIPFSVNHEYKLPCRGTICWVKNDNNSWQIAYFIEKKNEIYIASNFIQLTYPREFKEITFTNPKTY